MKAIKALLFIIVFHSSLIAQSGWFHQSPGTQGPLFSVTFANTETGYACGPGLILKTTNGGSNWSQLLQDTMIFRAMYFFNSNTGYVLSDNQYLFKTSNGGVNWSRSYFGTGIGYRKILFLNEQTGFTIGGFYGIYKTTNGGLNWNNYIIQNVDLTSIDFLNEHTGFIAGYTSDIYKTTNQGVNWSVLPTGLYGAYNSICFTDVNTGFIAGYYGKAAKTTNGGVSWDSLHLNTRITFFSMDFVNSTTGFICGTGLVLKTINGGNNWFSSFLDTLDYPQLYNIQFVNESTGFAVGHKPFGLSEGIILKTTNGGNVIGIQNITNEIPQTFSLLQNYPNPFNPATIINFQIPVKSYIKLIVYDVVGRELEILVNQVLNAGTYNTDWNASNYPSGVYYYKLTAGVYTETKKMVLVK